MSKIADAFTSQSRACASLGSPFMAQLCGVFAARLRPGSAITDRLFAWPGDVTALGHSVPLRLCGALHALRLQGCALLDPVYPPAQVSDDALWAGVSAAMAEHETFILERLDSAPQTNELRRSVALLAAGHWLTGRYNLPMVTRELGASSGLNLHWDRYAVEVPQGRLGADAPVLTLRPDWTGTLPQGPAPQVAERRGVDLNPLDPTRPEDALRLQSYLWPDQPERLALTQAAIADMRPAEVARGDAVDWLAGQLTPRQGHLRLVYHTIAWQYFPQDAQARGRALIEAAGAEATEQTPLAWVAMEADDGPRGAGLRVRLWPGNSTHHPARVCFHGRWIDWHGDA